MAGGGRRSTFKLQDVVANPDVPCHIPRAADPSITRMTHYDNVSFWPFEDSSGLLARTRRMMASVSLGPNWCGRRTMGLWWRVVAPTVVLSAGTVACGSASSSSVTPTDIGHIHDLVVDGDTLLVAAHRGLLRLDDGSYRFVGDEAHDLMAMTEESSGDLVAGGHPDRRLEQYQVDGARSYLGLVRSGDDGESWDIVGLLGETDFHALVVTDVGIVGGDSAGTVWQFDAAGNGQPVGTIPFDINDIAVSPDDPAAMVATSYDGDVAVSGDGGQTWAVRPGGPGILEIEWTAVGLTGLTAAGEVWTATDPVGPFEQGGRAPEGVESLLVNDAGMWVATHGGQIHRRDADGFWVPLVRTDD